MGVVSEVYGDGRGLAYLRSSAHARTTRLSTRQYKAPAGQRDFLKVSNEELNEFMLPEEMEAQQII